MLCLLQHQLLPVSEAAWTTGGMSFFVRSSRSPFLMLFLSFFFILSHPPPLVPLSLFVPPRVLTYSISLNYFLFSLSDPTLLFFILCSLHVQAEFFGKSFSFHNIL